MKVTLCLLFTALVVGLHAQPAHCDLFDETEAITLFAFDELAIPFTENLRLEMRKPQRHPQNPVVALGRSGEPDSWAVQFYGSVIREGEKFRMWYVAVGDERLEGGVPRSSPWNVAYAESTDGVNWTKPDLGLVEYRGDTDNNLVRLEPKLGLVNVKVVKDEDDAEYPWKMGAHVWWPKNERRLGTFVPYRSKDGLTWEAMIDFEPVGAEIMPEDMILDPLHFEPVGGFYKWDGVWFLSGQNAMKTARPYHGRVARKYISPDLVNWHHASAIAYAHPDQLEELGPGRSREGNQTHEGLSVWPRRNVLLGVGGLWYGGVEWKDVTIDLSLHYSHDGVFFKHPLHDWTFIERGEDGQWDQGGLLQGQGFENVGEQTYVYYGAWDPRNWRGSPPRGGVGIVTLPRDRFGSLKVDLRAEGPGDYQMRDTQSTLLTSRVERDGAHRFHVNATGLSPDARLRLELLDGRSEPLPGFSGDHAATVTTNGFQTPVQWPSGADTTDLPDSIRVKAHFEGPDKTDIRLHAIYIR